MAERIYFPPRVDDEPTPENVVCSQEGAEFSFLKQRRFRRDGSSYIGRGRGLAIFTDGCCLGNGGPSPRAGMGVYFGPDSPHNKSIPLRGNGLKTSQRAEIRAAIHALRTVDKLIRCDEIDTKHLAIISDSAYVVNAMTDWVVKWKDNGWINVKGHTVTNARDFMELDDMIQKLDNMDVAVRFWKVDREYNQDADELAREGARRS